MEIEDIIPMPRNVSDELSFRTEDIGIVTTENPELFSEDDECYMSDNNDIFGIFIGKDHPLIYKIMDLIENYNGEEYKDDTDDIIDMVSFKEE